VATSDPRSAATTRGVEDAEAALVRILARYDVGGDTRRQLVDLRWQLHRLVARNPERDEGRDSADVAEEFVAHAIAGESWETRDTDGQEPCWVERGVGDGCERFIEAPLSYLEACKIEALLVVARGD
jgi:hypothetical protein